MNEIESRREAARHANGEFGEQAKGTPAITSLNAGDDLSGYAPTEIDEQLATLYGQHYEHAVRLSSYSDHISREIGRRLHPEQRWKARATRAEIDDYIDAARTSGEDPLSLLRYADKINDELAAIDRLDYQSDILDDEFERRGGWTRAFLVNNSNGHVHSSMQCSTCTPTTRFHWVTEYSDSTEDEIVAAAGERACTVCYQ